MNQHGKRMRKGLPERNLTMNSAKLHETEVQQCTDQCSNSNQKNHQRTKEEKEKQSKREQIPKFNVK